MMSRRVHALLVSLPAVALATGAAVLGGLLLQSIRSGDDMARTVLIGLFGWPAAVAAVSFLGRAVRTARDSGRPDPVRTLGIVPVGGAWRIPVRRRHPLSTASLVVAGCGGVMALLAALGVLASPAWWHVAVSVAGSLLVGAGALAVISVLDRDGRASMVLDPREQRLILPRTRSRTQVVRIALDRVRAVTAESHGPLGLMQRVRIDFDDDLLGQGVQQTMLDGVDPGRAMDLVSWVRGFVASAARTPAASPASGSAVAGAPAAAAAIRAAATGSVPAAAPAPGTMAMAAGAPAAGAVAAPAAMPAQMTGASPAPMPSRGTVPLMRRPRPGSTFLSLVGRTNMPTALAGLGLACVLLFVGFGISVQPARSAASDGGPVAAASTPPATTWAGSLGSDVDGRTVRASDLDAEWIWTIDVSPTSGVSDEQVRVLGPLQQRFGGTVRFRIVLVSGDRGGELPTARQAIWYASQKRLPITSMLIRPDPGVPVPRHRMMTAEGRVVFESPGFMSAGSIGTQIGLHQAASRVEQHP